MRENVIVSIVKLPWLSLKGQDEWHILDCRKRECCHYAEAVLAQKFWGGVLPHQPLHYRVHFIRSPKPKKIRTPYRPTFLPLAFESGARSESGSTCPLPQRRTAPVSTPRRKSATASLPMDATLSRSLKRTKPSRSRNHRKVS